MNSNTAFDRTSLADSAMQQKGSRVISIAGIPFELRETKGHSLLIRSELAKLVTIDQLEAETARSRRPEQRTSQNEWRGRGQVVTAQLGDVQTIIRPLRRGGLVRYVNRDLFYRASGLSTLELRPMRELVILSLLKGMSAAVPEPIFALVSRCGLSRLYRGTIGTKMVDGGRSLLELVRTGSAPTDEVLAYAEETGRIASSIIRRAVLHPDLHPANVLVGPDRKITIIDFDKARFLASRSAEGEALKQLSGRWHRFVEKYSLPPEISRAFRGGLYGAYDRG